MKPEDDECCGRGCDPCIFDYYERALARWRERFGDPDPPFGESMKG